MGVFCQRCQQSGHAEAWHAFAYRRQWVVSRPAREALGHALREWIAERTTQEAAYGRL